MFSSIVSLKRNGSCVTMPISDRNTSTGTVRRSCPAIVTLPSRLARLSARSGLRSFTPPLPLPPFAVHVLWHSAAGDDAASRWLRQQLLAVALALPAGA